METIIGIIVNHLSPQTMAIVICVAVGIITLDYPLHYLANRTKTTWDNRILDFAVSLATFIKTNFTLGGVGRKHAEKVNAKETDSGYGGVV